MPAKEVLGAAIDQLIPPADGLGAINTVVFRDGQRIGCNTDMPAVKQLLTPYAGRPTLVLGAGRAALAAVAALNELSSPVVVASRDFKRAERLAARITCRTVPWSQRATIPFQVLVNATPCGADGTAVPIPLKGINRKEQVVLDAVQKETPTPLIRHIRSSGGVGIDGRQWWIQQGILQMECLANHRFDFTEMEEAFQVNG